MKILATFDESPLSEVILPVLTMLASLPDVEIELYSVAEVTAAFDEDAISKRRRELGDYLDRIVTRLPKGPLYSICTDVAMSPMDAATVVVEHAQSKHPDMIVMATHGRSGVVRMVLGSVADKIVHSGITPALLVHPPPAS
jgi:nucleotide-binding universal stress UspA family protein